MYCSCLPKAWRAVYRDVSVSLLKSVVLLDVVKVVSPENNRSLHLLTLHNSRQDSSTDAHIASERALLVNVFTLSSLK